MANRPERNKSLPSVCPKCGHATESNQTSCPQCGFAYDDVQDPMNTMDIGQHDLGSLSDPAQTDPEQFDLNRTAHGDGEMLDTDKTQSPDATYREDVVVQPDQVMRTEVGNPQSANYDTNKTLSANSSQTLGSGQVATNSPIDSGHGGNIEDTSKTMVSDHHGSSQGSVDGSKGRSRWGKVWKDIADSDASPMMTIKTEEVVHVDREGMVIQTRTLRQFNNNVDTSADYEIIQKVGEGSMGQVFTAKQSSVQRTVAIKTLKPKLAAKAADREKFLYEAMITGDLDHPNIVPIHDLGVSDDGTLFYSMKHVTGTEWQKVLDKKTVAENVSILLKVADAVAFAHSRRVIHRDLKPENIMLGQYGEVLVMDWGLAVNLGKESNFTRGGTPAFMAPEMAAHKVKKIDHRSDVYLLGAILYQLVIGYAPHPGRTVHECITAATRNIIIPAKKQDELLDIAFKAMATSPADRYQTVAEFQDAIREYQKHAESIAFSDRGYTDLERAKSEEGYESYSRAVFAFQDAIDLWPENTNAETGLVSARVAYAERALEKEDYDLGLSLVGPDDEKNVELYEKLKAGANDQRTRKKRLKFARRLATALGIVAVVGIAWGSIMVGIKQREVALAQTELGKQEKQLDEKTVALEKLDKDLRGKDLELFVEERKLTYTEKELTKSKSDLNATQIELDKQEIALEAKNRDLSAKDLDLFVKEKVLSFTNEELVKQIEIATANEKRANTKAIEANENAMLAKANELIAQLGGYKSKISLANQYINDGKVGLALNELDSVLKSGSVKKEFKGWELYRQYQLCNEDPDAAILPGSIIKIVALQNDHAMVLTNTGLLVRLNAQGQEIGRLQFDQALAQRIVDVDLSAGNNRLAVAIRQDWFNDQMGPDADVLVFKVDSEKPELLCTSKFYDDGAISVGFIGDSDVEIGVLGEIDTRKAVYQKFEIQNGALIKPNKAVPCGVYDERDSRTHHITGAKLSPSGDRLLLYQTARDDKIVDPSAVQRCVIVDVSDPKKATKFAPILNQHFFRESALAISCAEFIPSEQENRIVCGTNNGLVIIWDYVTDTYRYAVGHQDTVTDIAVKPVGTDKWHILTSGEDGRLITWDGTKGMLLNSFLGHKSEVTCCDFFPGSERLISGDAGTYTNNEMQGEVRHWTPGSKGDHKKWKTSANVFAMEQIDDNRLVTGNSEGNLTLYDREANKVGTPLPSPGHSSDEEIMLIVPRERADLLVTCSRDDTTRIWSLDKGHLIRTLRGTGKKGYGVVSADGNRFYSFADSDSEINNKIQEWDLQTGAKLRTFNATNANDNPAQLLSFKLSPDGRYLFAWNRATEGKMEIWDTTASGVQHVYKQNKEGERTETVSGVFFDMNTSRAIVQFTRGMIEKNIKFYSLDDQVQPIGQYDGAEGASDIGKYYGTGDRTIRLVFERNGTTMCVTEIPQDNGKNLLELFRLSDIEANQAGATPLAKQEVSGRVTSKITAINGGRQIAFLNLNGQFQLWDIQGDTLAATPASEFVRGARRITSTSDGSVCIIGNERVAKAFRPGSANPFFEIKSQPACQEISMSKTAEWIISRHEDNRAYIHPMSNGGFSPDNSVSIEQFCRDLACSQVDPTIAFAIDLGGKNLSRITFDGATAKIENLLSVPDENTFVSIHCHPTRNEIAIGSQDGQVLIIDVDQKKIVKVLEPDDKLDPEDAREAVVDVRYSPNGKILLSNQGIVATAWYTPNWTSEVFGQNRSRITSMAITREGPQAPQRFVLGRATGQGELYLIEPTDQGFASNENIPSQRSSDVFTFVANEEQKPINVVLMTNDGKTLLTATNGNDGKDSVISWFSKGWDKPAGQSADTPAISQID